MTGIVEKAAEKTQKPMRRLCNEIQLFDLCELEKCRHKEGQFCTDEELLNRFEEIDEQEQRPVEGFVPDEIEEEDDANGEGYDDAFDDDEYGDDENEEDE
ncbi:MAG: hypothetical protein JJE30_18135 [Desulfuromonadales bacterium]|nr:hypothetical protein [Desulfuromonadales bacterium]